MDTFEDLTEASTLLDADELLINHSNNISEKVSGIHVKESVLTVISGLTAGTALDDTDVIYVKKSNADLRKLTGAQIKAEVLGSISGLTAGTGLGDTDIVYIKDSSNNLKKLTGAQIKAQVLGSISDLTAASVLGDTDIVYIKDSNNDLKKLTGANLKGSISITAKLASSVTITGPVLSNGTQLEILFSSDIAGVDANTGLQINYNNTNYDVKVGKDGSLVAFKAYEVSTGVFKYLQAYTTLDLIFDGTQFVIVGNPVVISTSDFLVYSNGFFKNLNENVLSDVESITISTNASSQTTIQYDGFIYGENKSSYGGSYNLYINDNKYQFIYNQNGQNVGASGTFPVKKGDKVYSDMSSYKAWFYKNRDYSNR